MLQLDTIRRERLSACVKGIPDFLDNVVLQDVAALRLNIFADRFPTPLATVRRSALDANIQLMMRFVRSVGVELAPHGKTTLCPQIFQLQLEAGAWGITCASAAHLRTYLRHGVQRVIMANQLIDAAATKLVAEQLRTCPEFEFYGLVDSIEGVRIYQTAMAAAPTVRKLNLLVEVGIVDGRTGVRTPDDAMAVAREIAMYPTTLVFAGLAAFEGVFRGTPQENEPKVGELIANVETIAARCESLGLIDADEFVLSAGGSGYFDIVAESLASVKLSRPTRVILRSGCYVTHDHGFYAAAIARLCARSVAPMFTRQAFEPALEIWATVQSLPEPGLALITLGKRDVSHDLGLPVPLRLLRRQGAQMTDISKQATLVGLNDHHGYLQCPGLRLGVGDLVSVGISHPCTTFDRWRYLYAVDDAFNVIDVLRTFF